MSRYIFIFYIFKLEQGRKRLDTCLLGMKSQLESDSAVLTLTR